MVERLREAERTHIGFGFFYSALFLCDLLALEGDLFASEIASLAGAAAGRR
jgi:hypothetical protein